MALRNRSYWKERFEDLNERLLNIGEDYIPHMEISYEKAISNIQKEIEAFYQRFAKENELSYDDAKKLLDSHQRKEFQLTLEEYIQKGKENALDQRWMKELENASTIYRMDRLKALQLQMRQQIELLEAQKDKDFHEVLSKVYADGYYHTVYEIQTGLGVGSVFATLDIDKIQKVLVRPWAPDGKNFSQRIWGDDRTNLLYQLETRLTQGIIRGEGADSIIRDISKAMNTSRSAARRLVLTENAFFASASRLDAYKELDIEQYEYVATLDLKTSSICRSMDGMVFKKSEYKVGLNAPPLHVYCRSTTVPYFDDEFTYDEERAARGENGKTYYIPADMKYEDWYEQYVKTNPNMLLQERMLKNQYSDQKQYENYKKVLGKNAPKSFDKLRELKYNNSEEWNRLRQSFVDQPIRDKIQSDEQIKTIEIDKQGKHILGHKNYIEGRSYLTISLEEAQELVNKYAGTGEIRRTAAGAWNNKETIKADIDVGVFVDSNTNTESITNSFTIHYSKKGTHIVPSRRR
jgi:SPP1 gp7 family putative phage head morphogenesis protein